MRVGDIDPAVRRLALAVLVQALRDSQRRDVTGQQARWWLTHPTESLELWCACAGLAATQVTRMTARDRRRALDRLRQALTLRPAPLLDEAA